MNLLQGKRALVVYSSADVQSLIAAAIAYEANRAGVTLIDIKALTASNITVAIEAASTGQHYVFALTDTTAAGDDSELSMTQVATLYGKLIEDSLPTPVEEDAAQDGSTESTIKLATTASATNDYYNGMTVLVGTQYRRITDYVGSTKVATIAGTWDDIPLEAEDYTIYPVTSDYLFDDRMNGSVGKEYSYYMWEKIRAGINAPPVVTMLGGWKKWVDFGVMQADKRLQAVKETGATITAGNRIRNDYFNGMLIYVINGTGIGYTGVITDFVGSSLTLTLDPTVTLDNTSEYRITENERDVFADIRLRHAIMTYLADLTVGSTMRNWGLLLNKDGAIDNGSLDAKFDREYFWSLIESVGKPIFDYVLL